MNPPKFIFAQPDQSVSLPVSPELAHAIGLIPSMLIRQIAYWIYIDWNKPEYREGYWWLKMSTRQMQKYAFKFCHPDTIAASIVKLEEMGLVIRQRLSQEEAQQIAIVTAEARKLPGIAYVEGVGNSVGGVGNSVGGVGNSDTVSYIYKDYKKTKEKKKGDASPNGTQKSGSTNPTPPDENLHFLVLEIAKICKLSTSANKRRLTNAAKTLITSGYTKEHIQLFVKYWKEKDWRGKKGDTPTLKELLETLPVAVTTITPERAVTHECEECGDTHRHPEADLWLDEEIVFCYRCGRETAWRIWK